MSADRVSKLHLKAESTAFEDEREMLLRSAERLELKHMKVRFHRRAFKDEARAFYDTVIDVEG